MLSDAMRLKFWSHALTGGAYSCEGLKDIAKLRMAIFPPPHLIASVY